MTLFNFETGSQRIVRLRRERAARAALRPDLAPTKKPHLIDRWPMPLSPHNAVTHVADWRVACDPPRTKVCIYGAGMGKQEAPLDDPSWLVWAINLVAPYDAEHRLRCDAWFDLHQHVAQTAEDLRWIAACPVPIYVPPDLMAGSERAVRYPLADVEAAFGGVHYWSCTFAYQIALAMFMGDVTDIGLYGVELAFGTQRERTVEWACTAYWIGRAEERGIRVHRPRQTTLGTHPARYGFEYAAEIDAVNDYINMMRAATPEHDVAGTADDL